MPAGVKPVPWVDDTTAELYASPAISQHEAAIIAEKMKALDKLLAEKNLAKYKLEVTFDDERSMHRPFGGTMTWWESGNKLHGGGDSKLYLCDCNADYPQFEGKGCGAFLPDSANGLNFIVCPTCGVMWKNEEVVGEIWFRLPMQKWADVILRWFLRLEMNSDIRIKYARDDIRSAAFLEQERDRGGELLRQARDPERRSSSTYPLANIIRDTSAGAELRGRILAYLQA
jgi:hypothetical protein